MDDAVKVIKGKFRRMKGFELHKVYFVEDETSESTLEIVNAKGKKQGWTETFTQVIYFQTDFQTPQRSRKLWIQAWKQIRSIYIMAGFLHEVMVESGE